MEIKEGQDGFLETTGYGKRNILLQRFVGSYTVRTQMPRIGQRKEWKIDLKWNT